MFAERFGDGQVVDLAGLLVQVRASRRTRPGAARGRSARGGGARRRSAVVRWRSSSRIAPSTERSASRLCGGTPTASRCPLIVVALMPPPPVLSRAGRGGVRSRAGRSALAVAHRLLAQRAPPHPRHEHREQVAVRGELGERAGAVITAMAVHRPLQQLPAPPATASPWPAPLPVGRWCGGGGRGGGRGAGRRPSRNPASSAPGS